MNTMNMIRNVMITPRILRTSHRFEEIRERYFINCLAYAAITDRVFMLSLFQGAHQ